MKTHAWQRTTLALLFLPVLYIMSIYYGFDAMYIASMLVYVSIAITITSGYHRYFSHASYECSKFWQFTYAFIGTASLNSSPVEWASVHIAHHRHSDTPLDPYDSTWRQFFKFKNRTHVSVSKFLLPLLRSRMHRFFINHSATIALIVATCLLIVSLKAFLFLYFLPVSAYLFTSYTHNILAHTGNKPRDNYFLEIFIPMMGEWIHASHHANPKQKYYSDKVYLDFGGLFIRLIQNDSK